MNSNNIFWVIQGKDPEFPWWEDEQDWDNQIEARSALERLRRDWPASKWRLVKRGQEVVDE